MEDFGGLQIGLFLDIEYPIIKLDNLHIPLQSNQILFTLVIMKSLAYYGGGTSRCLLHYLDYPKNTIYFYSHA